MNSDGCGNHYTAVSFSYLDTIRLRLSHCCIVDAIKRSIVFDIEDYEVMHTVSIEENRQYQVPLS